MRFRVYRSRASDPGYPFLLDVQNSLIELPTRVVVPLRPVAAFAQRLPVLHPVFSVAGHEVVMSTHELASVPLRAIGAEVVSLEKAADTIVRALDFLFEGY